MAKNDKVQSWDEKLSRPTNDYDDSTRFTKGSQEWKDLEKEEEDDDDFSSSEGEDSSSLQGRDYRAGGGDNGYRRDPGNFSRDNNNGEQNGWYRDTPAPHETSRKDGSNTQQGKSPWKDDNNNDEANSRRDQAGSYMGQSDDYRQGNDDYLTSDRSQRSENYPRQGEQMDGQQQRGFQDRSQGNRDQVRGRH